jgi:hypothetical protein
MNTKIKFTRFIFALLLVISALGISTSTALADKPVKYEYTFPWNDVLSDICSFPINIVGINNYMEIDFFNKSGSLTRIYVHGVQQDTYSANGKTLVGLPYTYNVEMLFDSSGNITNNYANGVYEKIPLPDGSLFISAGRTNFMEHPNVGFLISPDKGNPGNIAGFCAALAP